MLELRQTHEVAGITDDQHAATEQEGWHLEASRSALQLKHASLNAEIMFEQQSPLPDSTKLDRLERDKVGIEDQLRWLRGR